MKCLALKSYGDNSSLEIIEKATPVVSPGQVLIKVTYAGLNPSDCLSLRIVRAEGKVVIKMG